MREARQAFDMRRGGRVRGKRSHKSRVTGRQRRDKWKQFDDPACTEFRLQPPRRMSHQRLMAKPASDERSGAGGDIMQVSAPRKCELIATVSSVTGSTSAGMHDGLGEEEEESTTAISCTALDTIAPGDGVDIIPAIEEAFHRELGIYENAVEGSNFSDTHFARRWGSVLSEESWSDVEFLESELESSEDDEEDWCMVS